MTPDNSHRSSLPLPAERTNPQADLFAPPALGKRAFPLIPGLVAGLLVLFVLIGVLLATHHSSKAPPNAILSPDPYAASLIFSDLQMSESSSLSAVKVTYIDGHITNHGTRTITRATLQVLFGNDEQLPPQVETVPLTLIRTHEPYIDTEPVSAAPIKPGDQREFRLIFENIGANWNQQLPQLHVVTVE